MNRTHWLAVTALLFAAQVHAQAKPSATPPAKPAPTMAPTKPTAAPPAAPAKPAVAAPAAPAAPTAAATKPATPPSAANDKNVEWAIDPGHSRIGFIARHLGFTKVEGQFKKYSAKISADPKSGKIAAFEAEADTASVDTGIEKRDNHLRSDEFFSAEKFPQLKLKLKSIKWSGNKFSAKADLTIRDITKEVPFKGELLGVHTVNFGQGPQQRAGYEAMSTISRKDFGLKYSALTEGLSVVGDAVDINLDAEISYVPPTAPTAAVTPPAAPAAPAKTAAAPPAAKPTTTAAAPVVAPPAAKPATAAAAPAHPK